MQRDQFDQQQQIFDTFSRPAVVNSECIIGKEKYPAAGKNCKNAIDERSQAYGGIVS